MCRKEQYQRRIIHEGAKEYRIKCATRYLYCTCQSAVIQVKDGKTNIFFLGAQDFLSLAKGSETLRHCYDCMTHEKLTKNNL